MAGDWKAACLNVIDDWARSGSFGLVLSPDVDGILSALLIRQKYPSTRIVGVYTTRHLLLSNGATGNDAREALWLDHDISDRGIRCIGQHLVLHTANDMLPRRHPVSFNPNIFFPQPYTDSFRGTAGRQRDKYPFGTSHLIMASLNAPEPALGTLAFAAYAHADGTWATALDYGFNCQAWKGAMFREGQVISTICNDYVTNPSALTQHRTLVQELLNVGINRRSSQENPNRQRPDGWKEIEGHQGIAGQPGSRPDLYVARLNDVAAYIARVVGVDPFPPLRHTRTITGEVLTPYPDSIPKGQFDDFMVREQIFSHAFKSLRMLRYTKQLDLN